MIEFRIKFCKDWSSRKKTYIEKQIGLFCANKPSEVYRNTLPPIPYPLYIFFKDLRIYIPNIYIYTLRDEIHIFQSIFL
jgi:hypothetical protein